MTSASSSPTESGTAGPDADSAPARFTPSHDALPPGARLDEFEIQRVLGEGGFGIVYLAMDHALKRPVAIKEYLPAALAGRGAGAQVSLRAPAHAATFAMGLRSFVNEARLLAQFDHPSLVRVYRFWEVNRTAYMAMPYYEGATLLSRMRAEPRPPDEAWLRGLLLPLLEALEGMHAVHCYHRDIAPDNILLLRDGRPVLLDFGAARRVIADQTQMLTAILKPAYAPIEQYAEADHLQQGPWTDLYALAAVVYFCVSGRSPTPSTARAVDDRLVPFVEVVRSLDREHDAPRYSDAFVSAIDWALAVRPRDRPQSAAQFRQALERGQRGAAVWSGRALSAGHARSGGAPRAATPEEFTAALQGQGQAQPSPEALHDLTSAPAAPDDVSEAAVRAALETALGSIGAASSRPMNMDSVPPSFGRPPTRPPPPPASRAVWWSVGLAVIVLVGAAGWNWNGNRLNEEIASVIGDTLPADLGIVAPPTSEGDDADARALAAAERARQALDRSTASATAPAKPTAAATPAPVEPGDEAQRTALIRSTAPAITAAKQPALGTAEAPVAKAAPQPEATSPAVTAGAAAVPKAAAQRAAERAAEASGNEAANPAGDKTESARARRTSQAAAPAAVPDTPREICAGRSNFSLYYCMDNQCDKPRFSNQPQCREFRAQEDAG